MSTFDINRVGSRAALLGYIRKKVSDPEAAEDILQESLAKALRSSDQLRDDQSMVGWLYRIINNTIIDHYRHRAVETKAMEWIGDEQQVSVAPEERANLCRCFVDLLPTLKPEYRTMIEELEMADGDPEEIADRLGITRANLKVRRHRARTQLRERLEETCRSCASHGCLDCSCARK
jgi:RNA polymerase sigma factor (sigma-70 family)